MRFLKECISCNIQFRPKGKQTKKCDSCQKEAEIKRLFKVYGKFKGITSLQEALGKYGK